MNKSGLTGMSQQVSDGVLISRYVQDGDEKSFETLMQRHYQTCYQRFLKHCRNPDQAADLTQQLWMQMVKNLAGYQDDGKFPSYLMRCASNLLTDHWRRKGVKDKVIQELKSDEHEQWFEDAPDPVANTESSVELDQQIDYLTTQLIPALPCEQRLAFLIKHESEYWDDKQKLNWRQLAVLNGMDETSAWGAFEQVRNTMLNRVTGGNEHTDTDCESLLLFLVWTQAQRPDKNREFTWNYFSKILNIPENTLKTRYRTALKTLAGGLSEVNRHD